MTSEAGFISWDYINNILSPILSVLNIANALSYFMFVGAIVNALGAIILGAPVGFEYVIIYAFVTLCYKYFKLVIYA